MKLFRCLSHHLTHLSGIALLLCFNLINSQAQQGCTDPQANNYNATATQNNGSCLYPVTNYTPVYQADLKSDLKEISGLHFANGEWWAHNDSGFDPDLFSVNPQNGDVLKKIGLKDANNRDWEDVCSDGLNIYLGDFGNNDNDRENLGIYRVPFDAIGSGSNQSVNDQEYSFIPFAYPDQTDFSTVSEDSTVFDCEAMLYHQGKLHLFTKNRREYITTHYALDLNTQLVQKLETFDSKGLITGASLSPDGKLIALVGYDLRGLPSVFCWLLWDWPAGTDQFFGGNKRRLELGSALSVGQVESIGFETDRSGYIANERTEYNGFLFVPQTTRSFDFSAFITESVATHSPAPKSLHISPNPSSGVFSLAPVGDQGMLQVFNTLGGQVFYSPEMPDTIDLSNLPAGVYNAKVTWRNGQVTFEKLVKQ